MNNLNTGFYKDLDTNFEQALEMAEKEFSHKEILEMLKTGNIPEKQIAAMKLCDINSQDEAEILISNLTGCDGKIREAVALKINQLLIKNHNYAKHFTQAEIFAEASIDINANICRLAIDSAKILSKDKHFLSIYLNRILVFINETFEELDKFIYRDKKYVINKQLFKLYWSLEALKNYVKDIPTNKLLNILDRTSREREYTIREKTAQILMLIKPESENIKIRDRLLNDENYYVRLAIKNYS